MKTYVIVIALVSSIACKSSPEKSVEKRTETKTPDDREQWRHLQPLMQRAINSYHQQDFSRGQALLLQRKAQIHGYSYGQYLLVELSLLSKDYAHAEKAYRRALELHSSIDPFPGGRATAWSGEHGLGLSLAMRGKYRKAIGVLKQSLEKARSLPEKKYQAVNQYDLACAYAELGNFGAALQHLKFSIELNKDYQDHARKDQSFARARERKDFRKLLALE